MALIGADTDELREVAEDFEQGKQVTDDVITFLRALILILKAASFFTGGASKAYATYLETVVVPWLEKISQALGLFAQVLKGQADTQDETSDASRVPLNPPSYQTPAGLPAPIQPYDGPPITGGPAPVGAGSGGSTGSGGAGGGAPATSRPDPLLSIDDDGTLLVDTGIPVGGMLGGLLGIEPHDATGRAEAGATVGARQSAPTEGTALQLGTPALGQSGPLGAAGADTGALGSGSGGGGGALGTGSVGEGSGADTSPGSTGVSSAAAADGGLGGPTPGAEAVDGEPGRPHAAPTDGGGASYGAAAGLAGGAAALGLGGAALAARGSGGDAEIDRLAETTGRGQRGEDVRSIQERLTAAGYDTGGTDGAWGPDTQAAYESYRADHPLANATGTGYTSPDGFDYTRISGVEGNARVTPEFLREVEGVAQRLGTQPEHLLTTMSFETGGSFDPTVRNPQSQAVGLIQFTEPAAQDLGTTRDALSRMTPSEQLPYVEEYFVRRRLGEPLPDLESVYTTVLAGHPASGQEALFERGTREYAQNAPLDRDGNGVVTAAEAVAHAQSRMR